MSRNRKNIRGLNRREALALGTAAICVPDFAFAQDPAFHDIVASHVNALVNENPPTLSMLIPEGSRSNLIPVVDSFFQSTGVKVVLQQVGVDTINTSITLDAMTGQGRYDLALPATFGIPDLVGAQTIIPLDKYVNKYEPKGYREEFLFNVGDSFDGRTFGFQTDGDAYVMFYNKDFLEDPIEIERYSKLYNVDLAIPKTWEELDRQMAFFNRPQDSKFGGLLFRTPGYVAWEWWIRFHAKGVWPLDENMTPQIDSVEGVSALEEMISASKSLAPGSTSFGLFENWKNFAQGNVYCNIGWGGSQKYFNRLESNVRGKLAYGPTPGGKLDGELVLTPYFNWGWDYVVTRASKYPELAYLFALYASSPHISTLAVQQSDGFFDPYRIEHYTDPGIEDAYSRDFLDIHKTSMINAIPDLYLQDQSAYLEALGEQISFALSGAIDAHSALSIAAQRWRIITARVGATEQKKRWGQLRQKYPTAVSSHLRHLEKT